MIDVTVDARGLKCPLPILKANRALRAAPPGAVVEVLSTDPISVEDFPDFCRATGAELIQHSREGDVFRFVIRRGVAGSGQ